MVSRQGPRTRDFLCSTVTMEFPGPFNDFLLRLYLYDTSFYAIVKSMLLENVIVKCDVTAFLPCYPLQVL